MLFILLFSKDLLLDNMIKVKGSRLVRDVD